MRTKAAYSLQAGRLEIGEVELAPPQPTEVLIRMRAAGVCHSDLHTYKGELRATPPLVIGHEGAGVVEAVGIRVRSVEPGDRVLVNWLPACESCPTCLSGRYNLCERLPGTTFKAMMLDGTSRLRTLDGTTLKHMLSAATMSEYAVIDEASAIPFPDDVPFEVAAVAGCAAATGVGAVINTARARPGLPAAVIGCGGVGLCIVQGCRLAGCNPIVALDLVDRKLEFARGFGATHTIDAASEDALERLRRITGGGAEYVFDSVGSPRTVPQALEAARPGGTATIVGLYGLKEEVPISPATLVLQNKRLLGSFMGSVRPRLDLPRLIELYRSGRLQLDEMITRRYTLEQLPQAFEDMEAGRVARGVIVFGSDPGAAGASG
jgi:S-(hydroxymethyl)glutathione dehydrogenase/alcohol dehydrogenase